jgi:hypothetical protein
MCDEPFPRRFPAARVGFARSLADARATRAGLRRILQFTQRNTQSNTRKTHLGQTISITTRAGIVTSAGGLGSRVNIRRRSTERPSLFVRMEGDSEWQDDSEDTERDQVLAPASHWQLFLIRLEKLLLKRFSYNRCVGSDDTNILVSVTERDLTKRFDELEINRSVVERQLEAWAFQAGEKLRVDLSFNYVQVGQQPAGSPLENGDKINAMSTTQHMLNERGA